MLEKSDLNKYQDQILSNQNIIVSIMNAIKQFDIFGYKLKLNFDKKGNEHKTFCGGLFTILIYLIFASFVVIKLKIMILFEDDHVI